jgi:hypothetical protein
MPDNIDCAVYDNAFRIRIFCHRQSYAIVLPFQEVAGIIGDYVSLGNMVQKRFNSQTQSEVAYRDYRKAQAVEEKTPDTHLVKPLRKIDLE